MVDQLKEQVNLAKQYAEYKAKSLKLIEELNKADKQQLIVQQALKKANEEVLTLERNKLGYVEQEAIKYKAIVDYLEQNKQAVKESVKQNRELLGSLNDQLDKLKQKKNLTKEEFDLNEEKISRLEKEAKFLIQTQIELKKIQKSNEEELKHKKLVKNFNEKQTDFLKNVVNKLGLTSQLSEGWLGRMEQAAAASLSIGGTLSNVGRVLKDVLHPTNMFQNAISFVSEATLKLAYDMDTTLASFSKATGTGDKFNKVIDEVRFKSLSAGVGLEESAKSVQALFDDFKAFNEMSKSSQIELARTTAELSAMGISAEITAKNLDLSTRALKMNTTEALNAQKEIIKEAQLLGLAPEKLAKDFTSSIPKLAQWGKQSVQIFKQLATQSRATGIEIQNLIAITQQFDTFESAATAAGKLNAILGGNLINSIELLSATESERIDMLRQSISLSGRNFNEMSKFERMAVASAAGISDMDAAARLFGTSAAVFEKTRKAEQALALSTQELTKYASQSVSVQQKLKLAVEGLSGATLPLLEKAVIPLINSFLKLNDFFGGALGPGIIAVTGSIWLLSKAIIFWNMITKGVTATKMFFVGILGLIKLKKDLDTESTLANAVAEGVAGNAKKKNILVTMGQAFWQGVKTAKEYAGTVAMFVYSAAEDLVALAKNSSTLATIRSTIAQGFSTVAKWAGVVASGALATAEWLAVGPTMALGVAIAIATSPITLIVLGIAALIVGIGLLVKHFDSINGWVQRVSSGFLDFWDVLLIVTGPIGWMISAGRKMYQNWSSVIGVFENLGKTVSRVFSKIWNIIKFPLNLGINAMSSIPKFAEGKTNFTGGLALVGEKGPELINLPHGTNVINNENSSKITQSAINLQAAKVNHTKQQIKTIEKSKQISEKITNQTTNSNNKDNGNRTIILQLNDRELARAVINIFNSKLKLNEV